ncbi:hypothetical protein KJ713_01845 [Patescibacteria group bacterium]|nr:hypothetical protein [Patescibacteria group bacterium]
MDQNLNNRNNQPTQNDSSNSWLPKEIGEIKLHANQIAKTESGWQKDRHQEIKEIRELASSPKIKSEEGAMELELRMRNIGMPGINYSGKALDQLDKREEAMVEERALRQQGMSYAGLNDQERQQAEARMYNGYNFRRDWQGIYDYSQINHQQFEAMPTTPLSKEIKRGLETMISNEIRLSAARDSRLGLDYQDHQKVAKLSREISDDPEFIRFLNGEKSYFPNTTNIKFEIEKRIKGQREIG